MNRLAILSGLIGPLLFGSVLTSLTLLNYDFLLGLGWHPLRAPTFDWPSGLALGAQGWIMTAAFILCGLMMTLFAIGLRAALAPGLPARAGTTLLALAGLALAGLAFTTDPTIQSTPATWHGRLHDAAFVLLGLTLLPAMGFLGRAFQADPGWQGLAFYTGASAALVLPAFLLKGLAFYVFLGGEFCCGARPQPGISAGWPALENFLVLPGLNFRYYRKMRPAWIPPGDPGFGVGPQPVRGREPGLRIA